MTPPPELDLLDFFLGTRTAVVVGVQLGDPALN